MAQSFSGTYAGTLNGTPATLLLQEDAAVVQGRVDVSGYQYVLQAQVQNNAGIGILQDVQTGGVLNVELAPMPQGVTLVLVSQNGFTGQMQRTALAFTRSEGTITDTAPPSSSTPAAVGGALDPLMVGVWAHQEIYNSGDFSGTTQETMQVHPDGTFVLGGGQVSVSGSFFSGNTGGGGETLHGFWQTQGNIVYVRGQGQTQWVPFARYYIENGRMLLTFGDGSRQVWYRQG